MSTPLEESQQRRHSWVFVVMKGRFDMMRHGKPRDGRHLIGKEELSKATQ
jgi:hypothetical protein